MIIFINGSLNAGKSTVARLLAKKLPDTALLEVDTLREMIAWMPIDQAVSISLKNAVSVIKNFVENGLHVAVPYPLSQKNYEDLMEQLRDVSVPILIFTLAPRLEKILMNRGSRDLNEWEKSRIQRHYATGIQSPSFGEIIDNSDQTPEETATYILRKVVYSKKYEPHA